MDSYFLSPLFWDTLYFVLYQLCQHRIYFTSALLSKIQYLYFRFHTNYFLLHWKIPDEIIWQMISGLP